MSNPFAIDDCNDLAKAIVVRTGSEHDPHWNDASEMVIAATNATVVQYGDRNESRSLQTVRDILSHPKRLETAIALMCESTCWNGKLATMGGQLCHFVDREKASVLTTTARHLKFLGTPTIAESTSRSTFDPSELRTGKLTAYLILPPDRMRAQSGLLRMWISSFLRAVVKGGLQ